MEKTSGNPFLRPEGYHYNSWQYYALDFMFIGTLALIIFAQTVLNARPVSLAEIIGYWAAEGILYQIRNRWQRQYLQNGQWNRGYKIHYLFFVLNMILNLAAGCFVSPENWTLFAGYTALAFLVSLFMARSYLKKYPVKTK